MKSRISKVEFSDQTIEKALELVKLEKECIKAKKSSIVETKNIALNKMVKFVNGISMEEMLAIDEYITRNHLLDELKNL